MVSYLSLLLLSKNFNRVVHSLCYYELLLSMLLCIIVAEVLTIFIDANTRIKGIQIGDHEIKIVNCADDTTIFLRNFSCLTKIVN